MRITISNCRLGVALTVALCQAAPVTWAAMPGDTKQTRVANHRIRVGVQRLYEARHYGQTHAAVADILRAMGPSDPHSTVTGTSVTGTSVCKMALQTTRAAAIDQAIHGLKTATSLGRRLGPKEFEQAVWGLESLLLSWAKIHRHAGGLHSQEKHIPGSKPYAQTKDLQALGISGALLPNEVANAVTRAKVFQHRRRLELLATRMLEVDASLGGWGRAEALIERFLSLVHPLVPLVTLDGNTPGPREPLPHPFRVTSHQDHADDIVFESQEPKGHIGRLGRAAYLALRSRVPVDKQETWCAQTQVSAYSEYVSAGLELRNHLDWVQRALAIPGCQSAPPPSSSD